MIKQHILNDLEKISSSNSTSEEKVFEAFKYGLAAILDREFCNAAFDLVSETDEEKKLFETNGTTS